MLTPVIRILILSLCVGGARTVSAATTSIPADTLGSQRARRPVGAQSLRTINGARTSSDSAKAWLEAAVTVLGGEQRVFGVRSIRMTGLDEFNGVPWSLHNERHSRPNLEVFSDLVDLERGRVRRTKDFIVASRAKPLSYATVVDSRDSSAALLINGVVRPSSVLLAGATLERMGYNPQIQLRAALRAPDARAASDTVIDASRYHVVSYDHDRSRLLLDIVNALPFAFETHTSAIDDPDWTLWGDLVTRTIWSSWSLDPAGMRFPRVWTVYRNGFLLERHNIADIAFNVPTPDDSFAIPDSVRAKVQRRTQLNSLSSDPARSPRELAPGVTLVPGGFNVMLVKQRDGIVVIEAPATPWYSRSILAEVARRYPGLPVKAVVLSNFIWDHFGGVREYIARGIPVYAPQGQRESLLRVVQSRHTIEPDSLARAPRPLALQTVGARMSIGTGANKIDLLYAATPGADYGERMLIAYVPDARLLYEGDLFSAGEANFVREGQRTLIDIVDREHLAVDTVLGIHEPPTPWHAVVDALSVSAPQ